MSPQAATGPTLDALIVAQPVDGGVAACVRALTEAAVAAGHRITVVSPSQPHEPLATEVRGIGASHVTSLGHQRRPHVRDLAYVFALRRLMRTFSVVHLHSSKAGAVGRLAALSLGKRRPAVVFTPHAWSWLVGGRLATVYRVVERFLAGKCDQIIAVSEREAKEGRRVLAKTSTPITVIENGVDLTKFTPDGPMAPRDHTVPLILCVGRLTRQKGQDVALRALAAMRNRRARIRFLGDGEAAESLAVLAAELGITERVEWMGSVSDPASHLRAADLVVAPSRWEGLSLVFLEGMACGAPMVVSDVNGSEVMGDAGVIVRPEQPETLAATLDELLEDEERRSELQRCALARRLDYDIDLSTSRVMTLWREVVEQRTRTLDRAGPSPSQHTGR